MPPRSLLLAALLLAAFAAAAQWLDVMYSAALNVTAKRVCALDANVCIFAAVLNATVDIRNTYAVAVYFDTSWWRWMTTSVLHPHTIVVRDSRINVTVYTPAGYILAPESIRVNDMVPDTIPLCGRNVTAVRVSAGAQRITGNLYYPCGWYYCYEPVRFLNHTNCGVFPLIEHIDMLRNITRGWAYVYILHMPTARRITVEYFGEVLNGTAHVYFTSIREVPPAGGGFYIVNRSRVPAVAVMSERMIYIGPRAFDMLNEHINTDYQRHALTVYTIGPYPGDGVAAVGIPFFVTISAPAELVLISDDTAGYFKINTIPRSHDVPIQVYARRYSIVELTLSDGIFTYTTRTIACPPYQSTAAERVFTIPARADAAKEIMICNNRTAAVYLALSVTHAGYEFLAFIDRVEPNDCHRLRWDGSIRVADTRLYIYPSAQAVCRRQPEAVRQGGRDYTAGWGYYLMPDNSLIPAAPIDPDTLYAELWRRIIENMARQYNETKTALQQWLQMQANATKKIEDYFKSLPRYQGTIRMESSTSTWLQAVLNAISSYTVPAPPPQGGGFAPSPLPAPSALSAAAAATAVATAWAASRRSLATAAFLAGFAVLASALFMHYLMGASVAAALIFAAVLLMSIGAAAAWFRKSED